MSTRYCQWTKKIVYIDNGENQCSMEEALLYFFYNGICPWVKESGYSWSMSDNQKIAQKFVRFCYQVDGVLKEGSHIELYMTHPNHRDLQEDRDTFDLYADSSSFIEVLEQWKFRTEIVGTRLEHMIRDFCYAWVDVTRGKPGRWTQATIDMTDDCVSDEDPLSYGPDTNMNRRKYDLY